MIKAVALMAALSASCAALHTAPSDASALNAKCLLVMDGVTRLDDRCSFTSNGETDSFSDERLLVVCPDGRPVQTSDCFGYQMRVARNGVYGFLQREGSAARLCWNTGNMRNAQACFDGLIQKGDCWQSIASRSLGRGTMHKLKFCAWDD